MHPTEELKVEHRAIKRVLHVLDRVCSAGQADEPVDLDQLEGIVEFIQIFADRCHHGKEEDLLFVAMEEAGVPRESGPIAVMLQEHVLGREYVSGMSHAVAALKVGDQTAWTDFCHNASQYVALLRQHIDKEDNILYPIADRVLTQEKQQTLSEGFDQIERERIGEGRHEAFHRFLEELDRRYGAGA